MLHVLVAIGMQILCIAVHRCSAYLPAAAVPQNLTSQLFHEEHRILNPAPLLAGVHDYGGQPPTCRPGSSQPAAASMQNSISKRCKRGLNPAPLLGEFYDMGPSHQPADLAAVKATLQDMPPPP